MSTYPSTALGTLLRTYRNKRKHSIASLSRACGVATGTISNLEHGWTRGPMVGSVVRIVDALKVPGDELVRAVMEDERYVEETV